MKSIIRSRCPRCGPVDLAPEAIELVAVPGRPIDPTHAHYDFTCPRCRKHVRKPADRITASILAGAGVHQVPPRHPVFASPSGHPEHPPGGPAISHDDLLELHELLSSDGWFALLTDPAA